jgi:hypothetical protein
MLSPLDHQHGVHMGLSDPKVKSRNVPAGQEHDIPSALGYISKTADGWQVKH